LLLDDGSFVAAACLGRDTPKSAKPTQLYYGAASAQHEAIAAH
jgi:hypothetical protein